MLAMECFEQLLNLSSQHKHALSNMGMVQAPQKKYHEALRCFEAAIAADAYFSGAWYNMALVLQCMNRGMEAMAAMKTADTLEVKACRCGRR